MIIRNQTLFCSNCASLDLVEFPDELLTELSNSKYDEVIKCNRCQQYFSKEYILENFIKFSDREVRNDIFEARKIINERYRKFDDARAEEERLKDLAKIARKDKCNPHHRIKPIANHQTVLFREV